MQNYTIYLVLVCFLSNLLSSRGPGIYLVSVSDTLQVELYL